jgi:hypothetical protein
MLAPNQKITPAEIEKIRSLDDFDLIMLISEVHDHGWPIARKTLAMMEPLDAASNAATSTRRRSHQDRGG